MSCNNYTTNSRPLGAGYDSRGNPRSLSELNSLAVSSVSATTSIYTNTLAPFTGGDITINGNLIVNGGMLTSTPYFSSLADVYSGTVFTHTYHVVVNGDGLLTTEPQPTPGATTLNELTDVALVTDPPNNGEVLTYETGTGWVALPPGAGSYQPLEPTLTNIAGVTEVANSYVYFNGSVTAVTGAITSQGRNILSESTPAGVTTLINAVTTDTFNTFTGTTAPGQYVAQAGGTYNNTFNFGPVNSSVVSATNYSGVSLSGSLRDVQIGSPITTQVLGWNGSKWAPQAPGAVYLYEAGDVDALQFPPTQPGHNYDLIAFDTGGDKFIAYHASAYIPAVANYIDHGSIAGLGDNDHPQYATTASLTNYTTTSTFNSFTATLPATYQPLDPTLTTLAAITTAADRMVYFTASDVATTAVLSQYARTFVSSTDASAARGNLSLSGPASSFVYYNISNVPVTSTITPYALTVLDDVNAASNRGTIGLSGPTDSFVYFSAANAPATSQTTITGRELISAGYNKNQLVYFDNTPVAGGLADPGDNAVLIYDLTNKINWLPTIGAAIGDVLTLDGAYVPVWSPPAGGPGGSPGGDTTQVQYNQAGAFAGDTALTWNQTSNLLSATNIRFGNASGTIVSATTVSAGTLHIGGSDGYIRNNGGSIYFYTPSAATNTYFPDGLSGSTINADTFQGNTGIIGSVDSTTLVGVNVTGTNIWGSNGISSIYLSGTRGFAINLSASVFSATTVSAINITATTLVGNTSISSLSISGTTLAGTTGDITTLNATTVTGVNVTGTNIWGSNGVSSAYLSGTRGFAINLSASVFSATQVSAVSGFIATSGFFISGNRVPYKPPVEILYQGSGTQTASTTGAAIIPIFSATILANTMAVGDSIKLEAWGEIMVSGVTGVAVNTSATFNYGDPAGLIWNGSLLAIASGTVPRAFYWEANVMAIGSASEFAFGKLEYATGATGANNGYGSIQATSNLQALFGITSAFYPSRLLSQDQRIQFGWGWVASPGAAGYCRALIVRMSLIRGVGNY